MTGWVQVHRSIWDHWIWEDSEKLKWWLDLILMANHQDRKIMINGELHTIERGMRHTSEAKLATRWGVSRNTTRKFLALLEKDGMIQLSKSRQKGTTYKVLNYDVYQGFNSGKKHQTEQRSNIDFDEKTENEPNFETSKTAKSEHHIKPLDTTFQEGLTQEKNNGLNNELNNGMNNGLNNGLNINNNVNNDNNVNNNNIVGQEEPEEKERIPYKEIIDHLNEKAGKSFNSKAAGNKKLIRARWNEGYRVDDFKKVIDNMVANWMGQMFNGKPAEQYLQPSTLFGNKFDKYLNQVPYSNNAGVNDDYDYRMEIYGMTQKEIEQMNSNKN